MFIITDKENAKDVVIFWGKQLKYQSNGYPVLVEENVAFPTEIVNVYEVDSIPEDLEADKYLYTQERGFELNPYWSESDPENIYGIPDELYHQIKDATVNQIQQEVNTNANS